MVFRQTILLRTRIAFLATLLFAISIVAKLVYIQCFQGSRWKKAAKTASLEYRPIKATRGNIYADDGSLLATSLPFYRVALDPCVVDETTFQDHIKALSEALANFYQDKTADVYRQTIEEARRAQRRYLVLNKRRVGHLAKKEMSQWPIFRLGRWRGGVIFEKAEKRFKPFQALAFRTIGFVNENARGAGLEYSFNKALQGINGRALYQKTLGGHWKALYNGSGQRPVHGYDIATTLDINLQDVAHNSLLQALRDSQAAYGCAIVMKVATGEIKALVNLSRKENGHYQERYNYAIGHQGATEPGSVFKLASMLALLEETGLPLTHIVDTGEGKFQFHDRTMEDVRKGGFGELTLQEVFEKSSNVGLARMVQETFGENPQLFIQYLHHLGLSQPLGFQMAGEGVPFIQDPQSPGWNSVTLPWMSIGYSLEITPLQVLTLYNAVANNGKMIQPIIVKKIQRANKTLKTFRSEVICKKICSEDTLKKLKIMLKGAVASGIARRFKHSFYQMAGKSGTANKVAEGRYTTDTHISFVGYFPAETPQYSCIVVLDSPKSYAWHFGASVAKVVKDIADKIAAKDLASQHFVSDLEPVGNAATFPLIKAGKREDLCRLCTAMAIPYHEPESPTPWVRTTIKKEQIVWQDNGSPAPKRVPHVRGMTLKDALFLLENCGLQVVTKGNLAGRVRTQSLLPGSKVTNDRRITIELST